MAPEKNEGKLGVSNQIYSFVCIDDQMIMYQCVCYLSSANVYYSDLFKIDTNSDINCSCIKHNSRSSTPGLNVSVSPGPSCSKHR